MIKKTSLIVLTALMVTGFSIASVSAASGVDPFQPILRELREKTAVPILLPSQLPQENYTILPQGSEATNPNPSVPTLYPYLVEASLSRYDISLDVTPECGGTGACKEGSIIGEQITAKTPEMPERFTELSELYRNDPNSQKPPVRRSPEPPESVQLSGGITGYFIPFTCGASCGESRVVWDQNGYRYQVGLESSEQQAVVNLANSAIENYE
ncbi:MAG: hypothetical protein GVY17_00490 [Cyanobacteria bacterium]|jgi:hypothetical protein|nr:hypothetical protein [Cyanobacteria bacterium GSL.Bin21]